ncbi:MAG: 4'-phosphopantetheinyl transferase superfamily protein [Saprospiraceae bacterium]|nr:4'-phosphopantetheinyl transferase superfamily protein [Saprospiraceae bacterium]
MIEIRYAEIRNESKTIISNYLPLLPDVMQHRIRQFKFPKDAKLCLFGKLLLINGLQSFGYSHRILEKVQYTSYNRPYLDNDIVFNISHSGSLVVVAVAEKLDLGVDVEEVKLIDIADFQDLFTQPELQSIYTAIRPLHQFFTLWTQKEALIKADGRGLSVELPQVKVLQSPAQVEDRPWHLTPLPIHRHYIAYLATRKLVAPDQIRIERIDFE